MQGGRFWQGGCHGKNGTRVIKIMLPMAGNASLVTRIITRSSLCWYASLRSQIFLVPIEKWLPVTAKRCSSTFNFDHLQSLHPKLPCIHAT